MYFSLRTQHKMMEHCARWRLQLLSPLQLLALASATFLRVEHRTHEGDISWGSGVDFGGTGEAHSPMQFLLTRHRKSF